MANSSQLRLAARTAASEKTPRGPLSGREGTPRGEGGGSARAGSKTPRDEGPAAALGPATSPNQRSRKLPRTAHSSGDTSWRSGALFLLRYYHNDYDINSVHHSLYCRQFHQQ